MIVECECSEALDQVSNPDSTFAMAGLVSLIKDLLREAWDANNVVVIPSSANTAATELATHCLGDEWGVDDFLVPQDVVRGIVEEEM